MYIGCSRIFLAVISWWGLGSSIFLTSHSPALMMMLEGSSFLTQCAAVKTTLGWIREPPHLYTLKTFSVPMIFVFLKAISMSSWQKSYFEWNGTHTHFVNTTIQGNSAYLDEFWGVSLTLCWNPLVFLLPQWLEIVNEVALDLQQISLLSGHLKEPLFEDRKFRNESIYIIIQRNILLGVFLIKNNYKK